MISARELRDKTKKMVPVEEHIKFIETILEQKAGEGFYQVAVYTPSVYFEAIKKILIQNGYEIQKGETVGNYSTMMYIYW